EHESGPHLRVGGRGAYLDWLVDLLHCPPARHARRGRGVSPLAGRAPRVLRQAVPPTRRPMHLLRAPPRPCTPSELRFRGTPRQPAASARAPASARWPTGSRPLASPSSCSSAATTCPERRTTGTVSRPR